MRLRDIFALCALAFLANEVYAELSCKDMDGKDVDWFIALKMPSLDKKLDSVHPDISKGIAFFYADSNNQEFRISKANINDPKSALGYTVSQAIDAYQSTKKDTMYMFYNDQQPCSENCPAVDDENSDKVGDDDSESEKEAQPKAPKKPAPKKSSKFEVFGKWVSQMMNKGEGKNGEKDLTNRAHAKGVMNFNDKQGFWLIHSSPRYNNPMSGKYFFPSNARRNGQSFFCGTFLSDQLGEISAQIFHSQFAIYQKNLPLEMAKKYPRLYHVIMMDKTVPSKSQCPYFRNAALKTKGGQWLQNYEKNVQADSDLYANQVTEGKQKSFFVETWLNGPRDWKNVCDGKFFTKNIRSLKHDQGIGWVSAKDHSKWAVSDQPKTVCIGDINRQKSQRKRGGGTMCIDNEKIWKFFRDSVDVVECCEKEKAGTGNCEAMPDDSIDVPKANRKFGDPDPEK
ncbi:Cell-death-related nuclease 7 [Aphelenchoides bicaudatus]|nr:Cell-death-related nuclease 7 [Aphelenchoides bicaudatus]